MIVIGQKTMFIVFAVLFIMVFAAYIYMQQNGEINIKMIFKTMEISITSASDYSSLKNK